MRILRRAPAKLNLYLHVLGRRADGYHLLDSLVAFTRFGDRVAVEPADGLSLMVCGPFAPALADLGEDNLVLRAARILAEMAGRTPKARLILEKNLPPASGLGGGSADAAATLSALCELWGPSEAGLLEAAARRLGADVPVCLAGRPAFLGGIGHDLAPAPALPAGPVLLVNPGKPLPTPAVFAARQGRFGACARFTAPLGDVRALADMLAARRNELTEAAIACCPDIAEVLDELTALPGALVARMSGSGATCFALFEDSASATAAAHTLTHARPAWWTAATTLAP